MKLYNDCLFNLNTQSKRHRTQKRKGEDQSPFINHPIQVANLLANEVGEKDPILLTAAILHDVIEDTVDTPEEKQVLIKQISELFGEKVFSLTLEVTEYLNNLSILNRNNISPHDYEANWKQFCLTIL